MWLQHEIASVYISESFIKSFLKKTLIEELLEPKINTVTFHVYHVASTDLVVAPPTPCHPNILVY